MGYTLNAVHNSKRSTPTAVAKLLSSGPRLQHLAQRAKAAVALCEQVREVLPAHLAAHITGASLRSNELSLAVDSAAFCARLRFEVPHLRANLAPIVGAAAVQRITVRVQPSRPATPPC